MKMSRECPGILSSENDDFKFLKNCEKHKMQVHHVHHSSRGRVTALSPNQLVVDQKHERNSSQRDVLYIFRNIEMSILVTFH